LLKTITGTVNVFAFYIVSVLNGDRKILLLVRKFFFFFAYFAISEFFTGLTHFLLAMAELTTGIFSTHWI